MKIWPKKTEAAPTAAEIPFPGVVEAMDGSAAVVEMETAASEGAGAYPITPSTQMGEGWALAVAEGKQNVNGRRLLFFEPEGEHAAAAVTAGMSMMGLRATNFSSGQGIAYMHESLYAAVGKRLTYVLNVAARAITKHALNVHAGHDDYHAVDDTGFFQLFAKDVQEVADLTLIAHRIAELSLNPGICAQDGFLTSHVIESMRLPERELVRQYLGDPADMILSPTPAQRMVFGDRRRRIPELFDLDYPAMLGVVQNQDSYAQGVAAQRPFYFDHVAALADQAMTEYARLTGRRYARANGYRIDDADYVIVGQGSVVSNAEAVADWFRRVRKLKVGVLNLTMFRPFPADHVTRLLKGKRGVVVMERTDQPLAVDAPMLREIRAAMLQGMENARFTSGVNEPFHGVTPVAPDDQPAFYSACFGLGSRDLQPGDIVAAVENALPGATNRRQFYLGIDFLRKGTRLPKLQIWQEEVADAYPDITGLSLPSSGNLNLMPDGAISVRIHSVGGWGAITMGKTLAMTVFDLFGMHIKANPKYGSEKKGQPTTFYATFAREPIRLNCELRHVDVVLSPDPNVFRHSNPLAGLAEGGVFIVQGEQEPAAFWEGLPVWARQEIIEKKLRLYVLDAFSIARSEASDVELRYRMQGAAFMGAFFAASPLLAREKGSESALFEGIREQLQKKFGAKGARVVDDNLRVIQRGFTELREVSLTPVVSGAEVLGDVPAIPDLLDEPDAGEGPGNAGRFWEQVCALCKLGQDGIADPFAAMSTIPAATGVVRDMSGVRLEVPEFIASKCTGCGQCWVQCPDAAIPGLVSRIDDIIGTAIDAATNGVPLDRIRQVAKPLGKETRKQLDANPAISFGDALSAAYPIIAGKIASDPDKRRALDVEFERVHSVAAAFPLARTRPYYDVPETRAKGSGGLLSITINPEACKGCNLCVEVCPDQALVTVKQDAAIVNRLRKSWDFWKRLPDTDDSYVNVSNINEGIGVLSSLLLKKDNYRSMVGGDGACMGCGEKTAVHLVVSTIHALMGPRVAKHVAKLDDLIDRLEAEGRNLLSRDLDLEQAAARSRNGELSVTLDDTQRERLELMSRAMHQLKDLRWRYTEGPAGKGRARLGMANSTGCSSVWGSTYPYNPYPFPWVNHLFQDAPSVAIGVFEGHMRKMADGFIGIRRAELLLSGEYDAATHEPQFVAFGWQQFTDEEFGLTPPIISMGGDGAMLDIGFQNLSRLLASGKPIRVVVLDTQVYSNTGGQACTSGFTGQVADMSAFGAAQHGKTEMRKELALIAIAHRGAFVHQSSQASASHLIAGVLKGLQTRRPAVFNLYTPCPVEHGLADDWSQHSARLALESRAFPFLTYDPDAGAALADCISLDGNPSVDTDWPEYTLKYVNVDGVESEMTLPLTIADWAATEGRFKKHFKALKGEATVEQVPFHEYLRLTPDEREGKTAFIHSVGQDRRLSRLSVSPEIAQLAAERQQFWLELRHLAGLEVSESVRDRLAQQSESEFEARAAKIRQEYEAKLAELRATYPLQVARKLAEGLLRSPGGQRLAHELLSSGAMPAAVAALPQVELPPGLTIEVPAAAPVAAAAPTTVTPAAPAATPIAAAAAAAVAAPAAEDDGLDIEAYIESVRCTTCNECTNLNSRMFAYDANKQAFIKDRKAGTFAQMVQAAEKCPVSAIHPGTPLNPKEKDLAKWIGRAKPFN
jgi:pyruvate-ferredoxin/flavodoxin oxidoreductase